jgi:arylsulfatase A-like enzyme
MAALLFLLLLAVPACGPAPLGATERPDILLISLDTLRADHLGCYGYDRDTSPFLDSLARRGTYFPCSFINTLGTTPSHVTMLSSLYQETHKVEYHHLEGQTAFDVIPGAVRLLPELLKQQGYVTLGVHGGGRMSPKFGFGRGFDEYVWRRTLDGQVGQMLELLDQHRAGGRPVFAFFHTYEVHAPYLPPDYLRDCFDPAPGLYEPTVENLRRFKRTVLEQLGPEDLAGFVASYDAGIRYTDEVMKGLFARLRQSGFLDNCLVVVTSDHGEEFGEHGGLLHRVLNFEELIQVPLIINGPGVPAGLMDGRMAVAVDIVPTILSYAGIAARPEMEGLDLLAPAPPERAGPEAAIVAQAGNLRYTLRTREWKLIQNIRQDRLELFNLTRDPAEQRNLAGHRRHRWQRDAMLRTLERWKSERLILPDERRKAELTGEDLDLLKELGYVYDDAGD